MIFLLFKTSEFSDTENIVAIALKFKLTDLSVTKCLQHIDRIANQTAPLLAETRLPMKAETKITVQAHKVLIQVLSTFFCFPVFADRSKNMKDKRSAIRIMGLALHRQLAKARTSLEFRPVSAEPLLFRLGSTQISNVICIDKLEF